MLARTTLAALMVGLVVMTVMLASCGTSPPRATEAPSPTYPLPTPTPGPPEHTPLPTATPNPDRPSPVQLNQHPLPTISPPERESASDTWLYLTAFQNGFVSVIDPISGHALQQIPVDADQAGMAVSPDCSRLYVVDGRFRQEGQLRVFDTATWQVIHREPVPDWVELIFGNPIALSPDGRWLVVRFYDYESARGWKRVFDTEQLQFLPGELSGTENCDLGRQGMVGRRDGGEVYVQCQGYVAVLSAKDLTVLRTIPSPVPSALDSRLGWARVGSAALAVSLDGNRLLGLYPVTERSTPYLLSELTTDLLLYVWDTRTREDPEVVKLSEQVSFPPATAGRGSAGYLVTSNDGQRLFVAWEDRLWSLDARSLRVLQELRLPSPVDGLVQSVDGEEIYLLPSTGGDLTVREKGMFTVDADTLELVRRARDWPDLNMPFFFSAPAP